MLYKIYKKVGPWAQVGPGPMGPGRARAPRPRQPPRRPRRDSPQGKIKKKDISLKITHIFLAKSLLYLEPQRPYDHLYGGFASVALICVRKRRISFFTKQSGYACCRVSFGAPILGSPQPPAATQSGYRPFVVPLCKGG